jgi:hypothetical protein
MTMEMRDRLIELLDNLGVIVNVPENVDEDGCGTYTVEGGEYVADYLLANGVIVPPCKVGDMTYIFDYDVRNHLETKFIGITPSVVEAITIVDDGLWIENEHAKYHITSVGDLIFLIKEEAEKALKEREGNG